MRLLCCEPLRYPVTDLHVAIFKTEAAGRRKTENEIDFNLKEFFFSSNLPVFGVELGIEIHSRF